MTTPARSAGESPERLLTFSDAVVAIALTLLAVELPVPDSGSEHAFFRSIQDNFGHYLAFVVSFGAVASAWRNHKRMTSFLRRSDSYFEGMTLIWLFTVALVPFAAKLLTIRSHPPQVVHACCFGFWSLLAAVASLTVLAAFRHAEGRGQVDATPDQAAALHRSCLSTVFGYSLSIPFFFVTNVAWVLWFAGPAVLWTVLRVRHGRRPEPEAGRPHPA